MRTLFVATIVAAPFLVARFNPLLAQAQPRPVSFVAAHSGKCLDVEGASREHGARVIQWDCVEGAGNQLWLPSRAPNGGWTLVAQHSRKCLEVGGGGANGVLIVQANCSPGSPLQVFDIQRAGPGSRLVSRATGKCVDVSQVSTSSGALVHQWDCLGEGQRNQYYAIRAGAVPGGAPASPPPAPAPPPPAARPQDLRVTVSNPLAGGSEKDICWKATVTRGVGAIPARCPAGTEPDATGLLCYPACRPGFVGRGPVCWQSGGCPQGFRDDGATCMKPTSTYGRGAGYGYVPVFESRGKAIERCEAAQGRGNCEMSAEMAYPKCRAGYVAHGCCLCSPVCPPGMTDSGIFCAKQSYGRTAGKIKECGPGLDSDAGLCYSPCPPGTTGVGPVCWAGCPADYPVACGASCAVSSSACALSIVNSVQSTSELALNFASLATTGGAATAGLRAARMAARTAGKQALSAAMRQQMKERARRALTNAQRRGQGGDRAETWIGRAGNLETAADLMVKAHEEGEIDLGVLIPNPEDLDPTGILAVFNSFNKPICGR